MHTACAASSGGGATRRCFSALVQSEVIRAIYADDSLYLLHGEEHTAAPRP